MIKYLSFRKPKRSNIILLRHTILYCTIPHDYSNVDKSPAKVNPFVYGRALRSCILGYNVSEGKAIHCHAVKNGDHLDLFSRNILLDFYVKFDMCNDAYNLFEEMPDRNHVSYVTIMQGLAKCGRSIDAAFLIPRIHRERHELNQFVFTTALKLFLNLGWPELGQHIHACIHKIGLDSNAFVASVLLDIYSNAGLVDSARNVFDGVPEKDDVLLTGMVTCYADNDRSKETVTFYSQMAKEGLRPNNFILNSLLKAAALLESLKLGRSIHACSIKTKYEDHPYVSSAIHDMYSKCGDIGEARVAFDMVSTHNVITWTSMISRYTLSNLCKEALQLFSQMLRTSVVPNEYSFSSALKACASMEKLELGKQIHAHVVTTGLYMEDFVVNSLMDCYAKCGDIDTSAHMFAGLLHRNEVTYNTIIVGHVNLGFGEDALRLFGQMRDEEIKGSQITYSSALKACASLAAIESTSQVHSLITKTPFIHSVVVENSLIDSYAKCGSIKDACKVFDMMDGRDVISWNAMISGLAIHGLASDAIRYFDEMKEDGIEPDKMSFVGVLSACSNIGLVKEGQNYFRSMVHDYSIEPHIEHYTCMVRLLGRAGHFDEALKLIEEMSMEPSAMIWRALLNACLVHKNVDLGKICAGRVLELEPEHESGYVLLSNIYARAGKWDDVAFTRKLMKSKGVKKEQGLSWIEVQGETHCFSAGDMRHADMRVICAMLEGLNLKFKKAGYVFDSSVILHDISEEEKGRLVWMHSERLALALGLVKVPNGRPIRIIKNLRFCLDCHATFKLVSKLVQREIVVRDMNRFHHFEDGNCSCGDYW